MKLPIRPLSPFTSLAISILIAALSLVPVTARSEVLCRDLFSGVLDGKAGGYDSIEVRLVFDPKNPISIADAINDVPLEQLGGAISPILHEAGYALRRTSAANLMLNGVDEIALIDPYTSQHSWAVGALALKIARVIGLSHEEQVLLFYAGLGHDLGKARIPLHIVQKQGKLTDLEFEEVKKHSNHLVDIYQKKAALDPELRYFVELGRDHHEKWDGSGYPNGKSGTGIPLGARILAIGDAFHALLSERPYKPAFSATKVIEILEAELAHPEKNNLDPEILQRTLEVFKRELARED